MVSDGTAVLGLGNIGPAAALPVMEGKAALFERVRRPQRVPIVLDTTDPDEIVETVVRIAPSFGGINLEDISAPRCFEIEDRLRDALTIPVFHDDQHGTAIVVLAALRNAARVTGRELGRPAGRRLRRGRRRRGLHQDPARRPASATSRWPTRRGSCHGGRTGSEPDARRELADVDQPRPG